MQFNLKVKVLKKSQDDHHPEHIIVERKSTHEMVHMYFNEGVLAKFTHIKRDPEIKMAWDDKEKRYKSLAPSYRVAQEFTVKNGETTYSKSPEADYLKFFGFSVGPIENSRTLGFRSSPDVLPDFFIEMDLDFKTKPLYIQDYGVAEVKEVYPHQKKRVHPLSKFIADGLIKS